MTLIRMMDGWMILEFYFAYKFRNIFLYIAVLFLFLCFYLLNDLIQGDLLLNLYGVLQRTTDLSYEYLYMNYIS